MKITFNIPSATSTHIINTVRAIEPKRLPNFSNSNGLSNDKPKALKGFLNLLNGSFPCVLFRKISGASGQFVLFSPHYKMTFYKDLST